MVIKSLFLAEGWSSVLLLFGGKSKYHPFPSSWFVPSLSHPHVCSPVMQQGRELILLEYMNFIVVGSGLFSVCGLLTTGLYGCVVVRC